MNTDTLQSLHDECGVFGIYSENEQVTALSVLALHALQHRGQESAGIVVGEGKRFHIHKAMGLVHEVFSSPSSQEYKGSKSIGHVRYSTSGSSHLVNAQPFLVDSLKGTLALAHNGNIVNAELLKKELAHKGVTFETESDSEVILQLILTSQAKSLQNALLESLGKVQGAYSLVVLTEDSLIAIRDPFGFRPLCLGVYKNNYCVASETSAFNQIGARYIREIKPGEMLVVNSQGLLSYSLMQSVTPQYCIFELIYLSRPDSLVFGKNVYGFRTMLGRTLARECPIDADLVVPVPDSGIPAALGYSKESGIPYDMALLRNHYVGRTFIHPDSLVRETKVKMKLSVISELVNGKRIIIVDDSIVRGVTSKEIVQMLRRHGAREIHFLSSAPPMTHPCFYGVNTPNRDELIAAVYHKDTEKIRQYLEVDSLYYLSLEGLFSSMEKQDQGSFCKACLTGKYPIAVQQAQYTELKHLPTL